MVVVLQILLHGLNARPVPVSSSGDPGVLGTPCNMLAMTFRDSLKQLEKTRHVCRIQNRDRGRMVPGYRRHAT